MPEQELVDRPEAPVPETLVSGEVVEKLVSDFENSPGTRRARERMKALLGLITGELPQIQIPLTTAKEAFEIEALDPDYPKIMFINAPVIGTLSPEDPRCNIFKNALKTAKAEECDAVILTGPVVFFPAQRHGSSRSARAHVIDVKVEPDLIEKSYPPRVFEKLGGVEGLHNEDKPVFFTTFAYMEHLIRIFKRMVRDENGNLLYDGPILVSLGSIEEDIASYYANERLRIAVFEEKARAKEEIANLRFLYRLLKAVGGPDDVIKVYERFGQQMREKGIVLDDVLNRNAENIEVEIVEWEAYRDILAIMTNAEPEFVKKWRPEMLGYIAHCYESVADNIKVVGVGDTFFKIGGDTYCITTDKMGDDLKGGLAGKMREAMYNFIKGHAGEKVVDVLVGAGLNPNVVGLFVTRRDWELEGTPDDVRMIPVIQLPTCIGASFYREVVRRMVKVRGNLERLVERTNFQSGVVMVEKDEKSSLRKFKVYTSDFLTNAELHGRPDGFIQAVRGLDRKSREVLIYLTGDEHYGSHSIARYYSPNNPDGRLIMYHYQVALQMMLDNNVPIMLFCCHGDIHQWMNVQYHREGNHPHLKSPEDLIEFMQQMEGRQFSRREKERILKTLLLETRILSGTLQPQEQVQEFVETLRPFMVFFKEVIQRARNCGIVTDGNLGIVTWGGGNHNKNTFKRSDVRFDEGILTRDKLLYELTYAYPEFRDLFREQIQAPSFGGLGYANGLFAVNNTVSTNGKRLALRKEEGLHCYGVNILHKQRTGQMPRNNLAGMIRSFGWSGTADQYESGHFIFNGSGDDHFGGFVILGNTYHARTGGQMFEGPFGREMQAPEQNIFSVISGVPVGGPQYGPLSFVALDYQAARRYAVQPVVLNQKLFATTLRPEEKKRKRRRNRRGSAEIKS